MNVDYRADVLIENADGFRIGAVGALNPARQHAVDAGLAYRIMNVPGQFGVNRACRNALLDGLLCPYGYGPRPCDFPMPLPFFGDNQLELRG